MQLILQTANVTADAKNCSYPNKVTVTNASELQEAVKMDHVCAEYKNNYRSIDNFLKSNVVVMDLDNDHTDDPDEWITAEKLEELLPDISYAVAPSRNHMVAKYGKAARPKYHVYFEIEEITDSAEYAALKAAIHNAYPFFDGNALDAARFIFGADSGEAVWHEGWTTIDEDIVVEITNEETPSSSGPILEGSRNNTMSRFASRVLKKYGVTDKAREAFEIHAQRCDPPLEEEELNTIWNSAVRFYKKTIVTQEGYVAPDQYNAEFGSIKPDDYSDMGEARALVEEYKGELLYTGNAENMCWTASGVLQLLSNEIYTGAVVALKSTFDTVTGKLKVKPKEEWSKVEGMHEAIVSKEIFQKAQDMIVPQKSPSETRKQHYICGCCGRGLNRRNGTDLYCARGYFLEDDCECRVVKAKEPTLDGIVLKELKAKLLRVMDTEELKLEAKSSDPSTACNLESLKGALESVKKAKQMLFEKLADRSIDRETFKEKKAQYDSEIAELEQRISDVSLAESLSVEADEKVDEVKSFLEVATLTDDMWEKFLQDVIVYPGGRLEIHWNFEEEF